MKSTRPTSLTLLLLFFLLHLTGNAAEQVRAKLISPALTAADPLGVVDNYLNGAPAAQNEPVTVNVLALRAQFVLDSLKTTTGDGHFDLSAESQYIIDRPPHNKTYFEHQLLALRNYFATVSKGNLILNYAVYPPAQDAAYQMPHDMVYYSGEEDDEKQALRWAELLRDAVTAAQIDNPDFGNVDAVIVFHAGVGNDFAFDFTESPFDIQSAFIDLETLRSTIGNDDPNYQGIPVGANVFVREGIILPEQQNQKEIDLGLLGTAALLMGSQLGMPSLFNTGDGRAGVGMWGLMDQGSYNYYGLIPAQPCAWMKVYMGWETPVVVNTIHEAVIGTANTKSAPHLYKVPINSSEYFLLENRQEDWNGDGITFGRDENGNRAQFDSLGNIAVEAGLGVITRVDEYDYGLPGSGILIWHIDEQVIRANLATNTINNNPNHRGVDLVECDGPQDIGQRYAMFTPGYGTEAGDYWDPFWDGNISHKYINGERPVELSPTSIPPSNAYGRANTHIRFANFSGNDTLMTFSISNDWFLTGFPQYTGQSFGEGALNYIGLADGKRGIIAVAKNGDIFGWRMDGSKIIDNDETITVTDELGNETTHPLALMASVGDSVLLPPAVFDFQNDGIEDIVIVDKSGIFTVWTAEDKNADGRTDLLLRHDFGEPVTTIPTSDFVVGTALGKYIHYFLEGEGASLQIKVDKTINVASEPLSQYHPDLKIIASRAGNICQLDYYADGNNVVWQTRAYGNGDKYYVATTRRVEPLSGDHDPIAVVSNDGYLTLLDWDGNILNSETRISQTGFSSAPALGDIDNDGMQELLVATETHFAVYELAEGVTTLNFPVTIENQVDDNKVVSSPVFFMSEKNGAPWAHALIGTSTGQLFAFDDKGDMVDGFPLSTGKAVVGSPLIMPVDESNQGMLLFALLNEGSLSGWNINRGYGQTPRWERFGGTPDNQFHADGQEPAQPKSTDLMPKSRVFCYPNPSIDGRTIIRYTLNDAVNAINIRIYDIAGDLVTQFNNGGTFAGDHEVVWDVSGIQSGAYIARVEAQSNNGNVTEFIKIAVVK